MKTAFESNKIVLGRDVTIKNLKSGKLSAVVFASNCPKEWKANFDDLAKKGKVETYDYNGNGLDLGALCKRPFAVTVAGVLK